MGISFGRNTNPILVTGSHRGGTTWVGKMIALSPRTYYLGEVFHPKDDTFHLGEYLLNHWYKYIVREEYEFFSTKLRKIFSLDFVWPNRRGFRRLLPSRLVLLKRTHNWFGLPRVIMKDPFAAFSAEWLSEEFQMNVVCIIRHPAAVVTSLKRVNWRFDFRNFLNQPQLIDDWLTSYADKLAAPPTDLVEEGALLWACIYHVISSYMKHHPEWVCLRLEDISKDVINWFEFIYTKLDLPFSMWVRHRISQYSKPTNPIETPKDDPHLIRRNSRAVQSMWRSVLSSEEILKIRRIVEPVAYQYYSDMDWKI